MSSAFSHYKLLPLSDSAECSVNWSSALAEMPSFGSFVEAASFYASVMAQQEKAELTPRNAQWKKRNQCLKFSHLHMPPSLPRNNILKI